MIPIFEPYLIGNEKKYLMDCIDTNWISSQGNYIRKFEKALSEYHKIKYAIVTSNCTTSLHLSLKSLGIGSGDEVICPDLTFIAPANMILLSGAKLILVDIDPKTLTINPSLIEKKITSKTKAIMIVHQFGHSAHMDELKELAIQYDLKLIEDNAESLGAKYKNKLLGTFGDVSTYSFFGNKIITTGEGGAVLTDNDDIALKCRELRDHGMSHKKKYHHIDLGYNYRMTNMQAAIGLAQIENLDKILDIRKKQMNLYYKLLKNIEGLHLRKFSKWCSPVHWLMTIKLADKYDRDNFILYMKQNSVECRQMVNPVHKANHLQTSYNEEEFKQSLSNSLQSVHLPSGSSLDKNTIEFICKNVKSFFNKNK